MERIGTPVASASQSDSGATRAAEYVRMSTEHQQYSTENQSEVIRQYALKRGMTIVRTYTDAGKSGLRLDGRDALKQLIRDVESGVADFKAILVYDVRRWGRFQDADERPITNTYVAAQKSMFIIAASNLKTMAARSPRS